MCFSMRSVSGGRCGVFATRGVCGLAYMLHTAVEACERFREYAIGSKDDREGRVRLTRTPGQDDICFTVSIAMNRVSVSREMKGMPSQSFRGSKKLVLEDTWSNRSAKVEAECRLRVITICCRATLCPLTRSLVKGLDSQVLQRCCINNLPDANIRIGPSYSAL